jgi:hypothetical protein
MDATKYIAMYAINTRPKAEFVVEQRKKVAFCENHTYIGYDLWNLGARRHFSGAANEFPQNTGNLSVWARSLGGRRTSGQTGENPHRLAILSSQIATAIG